MSDYAGPDRTCICVTIGDPTGIGPEITAKFLNEQDLIASYELIILGDIQSLLATADGLNLPLPENNRITYLEMLNRDCREPGQIAYRAVCEGVRLIAEGRAKALVTGPISKENLHRAGIDYGGHTEMLQDLAEKHWGEKYQSDMLFLYRQFRMLLLTRHVPLSGVSRALSTDGVSRSLKSLIAFLQTHAGITRPRLGVLGVNPHAGEIGGNEEREILIPAIEAVMKATDSVIEGPLPGDAVFRGFDPDNPPCDAYVAAYHDQGLIPMKLLAGLRAVNVTIGLPFLRTSVSHGTAPDIAGKGKAAHESLVSAFMSAVHLKH